MSLLKSCYLIGRPGDSEGKTHTYKIADYIKLNERSLWTCDIDITGSLLVGSSEQFGDTTLSLAAEPIVVVSYGRENKSPVLHEDGTYEIGEIDGFNPEGPYGKIPDEQLNKIRYNHKGYYLSGGEETPTPGNFFVAYFLFQQINTNMILANDAEGNPPARPPYWSEWVVTDIDEDNGVSHVDGTFCSIGSATLLLEQYAIPPPSPGCPQINTETKEIYTNFLYGIDLGYWTYNFTSINFIIDGIEVPSPYGQPNVEGFSVTVTWDPDDEREF